MRKFNYTMESHHQAARVPFVDSGGVITSHPVLSKCCSGLVYPCRTRAPNSASRLIRRLQNVAGQSACIWMPPYVTPEDNNVASVQWLFYWRKILLLAVRCSFFSWPFTILARRYAWCMLVNEERESWQKKLSATCCKSKSLKFSQILESTHFLISK
jgi:hypothetical protein